MHRYVCTHLYVNTCMSYDRIHPSIYLSNYL